MRLLHITVYALIALAWAWIAISCAPVGEYEILIKDKRVSRRAVYEATDWINREIDCDLFVVLPGHGGWWDWFKRQPRRGVITIERDHASVKDPEHPHRAGYAIWKRCNRGRVYLSNRSATRPAAIAHELGHIACLEHEGGTFMAKDIGVSSMEMNQEQRESLSGRCGG